METTQARFDYSTRENPMGESRKDALRVNLDRKLKLEFHASISHQRRGFETAQGAVQYERKSLGERVVGSRAITVTRRQGSYSHETELYQYTPAINS